jgi:hypothetical protein
VRIPIGGVPCLTLILNVAWGGRLVWDQIADYFGGALEKRRRLQQR